MDTRRSDMSNFLLFLKVLGAICAVLAGEIIAPMERVGLMQVFQ